MADISKIKLPSGTTYNFKDEWARTQIEGLVGGSAIIFSGVSSTALTDGGTEQPTIDGTAVTPTTGQLYFYGTGEYVWGADSKWHELGMLDNLGSLAYSNTASGSTSYTPAGTVSKPSFTGSSSSVTITATDNTSGNYQPKGTVSQPTFTGNTLTSTGSFTPAGSVSVSTKTTANKTADVSTTTGTATYTPAGSVSAPTISIDSAGSTTTIKNPTKATVATAVTVAAPGETAPSNALTYYSVANETLSLYQIGYNTGDSITTSNITVKTGDASYTATQPSFTGTGVHLVTGNIAVPATYEASFSGTSGSVSVSGTPGGTVSQPTFTGTKAQLSGSTTAAGSVSQPSFTGTAGTISITASGD